MKIIKGKEAKYKKFVYDSIFDDKDVVPGVPPLMSYIMTILAAIELLGEALDDGFAPDDAIKEMKAAYPHITYLMLVLVVQNVCNFNPRGEELRIFWDKEKTEKTHSSMPEPLPPVTVITVDYKPKRAD